jgi:hypothetical protein
MKNIDILLRTMASTALESRKFPKKAQGNNTVINQLYMTVEAAAVTQHAQRHNKNAINEIFDRSTLVEAKEQTPEEKVTAAAKTMAKRRNSKAKVEQ